MVDIRQKADFWGAQTKSPPAMIGGVARSAEGVDEFNAIYLLPKNSQDAIYISLHSVSFVAEGNLFVAY